VLRDVISKVESNTTVGKITQFFKKNLEVTPVIEKIQRKKAA